jgi:hypothetical protein
VQGERNASAAFAPEGRIEKGMGDLDELLRLLEGKLETTRKMIDEFDERMDYATHCSLQGFAEGIAYAIEEIRGLVGEGAKNGPE